MKVFNSKKNYLKYRNNTSKIKVGIYLKSIQYRKKVFEYSYSNILQN